MSWPSATVQGVEGGLQDEMALGQDAYILAQRNCRGRRGVGTNKYATALGQDGYVMAQRNCSGGPGGGIERNIGRRCEQTL